MCKKQSNKNKDSRPIDLTREAFGNARLSIDKEIPESISQPVAKAFETINIFPDRNVLNDSLKSDRWHNYRKADQATHPARQGLYNVRLSNGNEQKATFNPFSDDPFDVSPTGWFDDNNSIDDQVIEWFEVLATP